MHSSPSSQPHSNTPPQPSGRLLPHVPSSQVLGWQASHAPGVPSSEAVQVGSSSEQVQLMAGASSHPDGRSTPHLPSCRQHGAQGAQKRWPQPERTAAREQQTTRMPGPAGRLTLTRMHVRARHSPLYSGELQVRGVHRGLGKQTPWSVHTPGTVAPITLLLGEGASQSVPSASESTSYEQVPSLAEQDQVVHGRCRQGHAAHRTVEPPADQVRSPQAVQLLVPKPAAQTGQDAWPVLAVFVLPVGQALHFFAPAALNVPTLHLAQVVAVLAYHPWRTPHAGEGGMQTYSMQSSRRRRRQQLPGLQPGPLGASSGLTAGQGGSGVVAAAAATALVYVAVLLLQGAAARAVRRQNNGQSHQ